MNYDVDDCVAQAQGILMVRYDIDPARALTRLIDYSLDFEMGLADAASLVVVSSGHLR